MAEWDLLFFRKHRKEKVWMQRALERCCGIFKQQSIPHYARSHNAFFMEHGSYLGKDGVRKNLRSLYQKWKVSPAYSAYSCSWQTLMSSLCILSK